MPTPVVVGTEIKEIDIFELLPPDEGSIDQYYGRIGTGKTIAGTRRVLRELRRGVVVYANWRIKWEGYDERKDKICLILGLLGLKRDFYYFPPENFHYWDIENSKINGLRCKDFIDQLASLTDCSVHLDEGHIPFDSYEATRMDIKKRTAVLGTRHFNRSLVIYSQRPTAIHVTLRANVNRFFKCELIRDWRIFGRRFLRFCVTEFQDMTSTGTVDETLNRDEDGAEIPGDYKFKVSEEFYWGTKKLFNAYDSKYLRGDTPRSQINQAKGFELTLKEKIYELFSNH